MSGHRPWAQIRRKRTRMFKYRNVRHGRVVERPAEDKWLEASAGWERIDEPALEPEAENDDEGTDD